MGKKAFTLIELIAVIIIISLLGLVVFPVVNSTIKNSKEKALAIQLNNIIEGAKGWASENMFDLPIEPGTSMSITLSTLKDSGFVDQEIINPKTKKEFPNTLVVKITKDKEYDSYNYEIDETTIGS